MKNNFSLHINQPCSQRFENFETTQNGGFCASCQTEVIDFTKMSENEIKAYFKHPSKKVCGRFRDSQLKTYSNDAKPPKRKFKLVLGLFGISLFSLFTISESKAKVPKEPKSIEILPELKKVKVIQTNTNVYTIEGSITDENGEGIPGAVVFVKDNQTIGVPTSYEGKFKLSIPDSYKEVVLVFRAIGYTEQEMVLNTATQRNIEINMKLVEECFMTGEISVNQIYQSKPSLWQKIKNKFRKNE